MNDVSRHDSALVGDAGPGTTWANRVLYKAPFIYWVAFYLIYGMINRFFMLGFFSVLIKKSLS